MKKIILLIAIITFTGTMFAQKPMKKNFDKKVFMHENMISKLNLTDDQLDKFNQLKFSFEENRIDIMTKLEKNRLEIKKIMTADKINQSELMKLTEEGSKLRAELNKARTNMWLNIYNILDDAQKNLWKKHFLENKFMENRSWHRFRNNFEFMKEIN